MKDYDVRGINTQGAIRKCNTGHFMRSDFSRFYVYLSDSILFVFRIDLTRSMIIMFGYVIACHSLFNEAFNILLLIGVFRLNIKEISHESGLAYSTTRKYLVLLEEAELLKSSIEEGSRVFEGQAVRYVKRLASLKKKKKKKKEALEKIKEAPYQVSDDSEVAVLQKQINDLSKEVRSLSDLLQVELSKQKALPERSGQGFWYHLKAAFNSLFRRK